MDTASCRVIPPTSFSRLMNSCSSPSTAILRSCRGGASAGRRVGQRVGQRGAGGTGAGSQLPAAQHSTATATATAHPSASQPNHPIPAQRAAREPGGRQAHLCAREVHLPGHPAGVPGQRVRLLNRLPLNLQARSVGRAGRALWGRRRPSVQWGQPGWVGPRETICSDVLARMPAPCCTR